MKGSVSRVMGGHFVTRVSVTLHLCFGNITVAAAQNMDGGGGN